MATSIMSSQSLEYVPSLVSSSTPSTTDSPGLHSKISFSTGTPSPVGNTLRGNSLLGRLPVDFSSLIRSHSISHRQSAVPQSDSRGKALFTYYANLEPYKETLQSTDMFATHDDDRPFRKSKKSENKFYNFITRSSSRSKSQSRSRKGSVSNVDVASEMPELSHDCSSDATSSHSRQSSVSSRGGIDVRPVSSKRSILRPLSTTTTATNTTITPPTPKARRSIPAPIYVPSSSNHENHDLSSSSAPSTPRGGAKRKVHSLFGLASSRKASISSNRTDSPRTSLEQSSAPMPKLSSSARLQSTESSSKFWMARIPAVSSKNSVKGKLPADSSNHINHVVLNPRSQPIDIASKHPIANAVRVSHPRPHGISHRSGLTEALESTSHLPPMPVSRSISSESNRTPQLPTFSSSLHRRQMTGRSYQQSSVSSQGVSEDGTLRSRTSKELSHPHSLGKLVLRASGVESHSKRPPPMAMVDEELGGTETDFINHQAFADTDVALNAADVTLTSNSPTTTKHLKGHIITGGTMRETKHGSFEFERLGSSPSGISRSASGSHARTGGTYGANISKESLRKSKADTAKLPNEAPGTSLLNRRRYRAKQSPSTEPVPLQPDHTGASSSSHSRSNSADPNSSSIGRSAGKRVLGNGIGRLVGISHGPFSFEPPVPSPTNSHTSVSTKDSRVSMGASAGVERLKERHRLERAREKQRERERQLELQMEYERTMAREREQERVKEKKRITRRISEVQAHHASNSSVSSNRSSGKGRSLDLDLGLSWAPTKIREDILLPSSLLRARGTNSNSTSSRNGVRRDGMDEDRSKVGKDIADAFKRVLDPEAYALFKKYVHRFDAHDIPFDGPTGIITRAERLLDNASTLPDLNKRQLLNDLVRIILQNA